jgi:hypothetical protein
LKKEKLMVREFIFCLTEPFIKEILKIIMLKERVNFSLVQKHMKDNSKIINSTAKEGS